MNEAPPTSNPAPLALGLQIDQVCDRFEVAWKAGQQPRIEDYLNDRPQAEQAALLRELLAVELWYRCAQQERPVPAEYQQRFADHAELIQTVFQALATGPELATGPDRAGAPSPLPLSPSE